MLAVRDLTLAYGGAEPVLAGVNLEVPAGRFVSLVGPSGSGKSSILRAVMGLQAPEGGAVSLGVPREEVGFLFQDDALLPWRTAAQNVALGLTIRGVAKTEALARAHTWLGRLGLTGFEDRFPRRLSGGQRKRVALAQVLALGPRLLLMDEPFASLDAIVRHRITQDVLRWTERERLTVLLVTHDLEEAISLSDTIYLLSNGPRARVKERYEVPLPRPRDPIVTRTLPGFAPLLKRLWSDLEGAFAAPSPTAPLEGATR
ncbi:ABC transporter ATP-binding protein [Truepera radiovictrix]|uniref:ABC transporter related protein n=1 Tax=Truepera radiovictrix (strain DSM 17093 / CIP 108686 / LMG 22925 / RQ-24) TaxID=649638 RepID=D7CSZ6_TRURR|nr:ABC transporter ATP-binding protein [Truepera radiovictrix]ADI13763.1 ABC transporter related protein [Truepera radiovictrix DSM 17093]WMT57672.1 ABC transporter ATP-binding protein [Truepera radiovictrix]